MSPRSGARIRVLVVDDSAVVRQVLVSLLAGHGMDVVVAPDPILAMDRMKRARPDVIVLDLEMPRMDGVTFLQRLASEPPVPVVLCSGASDAHVAAAAAIAGPNVTVVRKPRIGVRDFLHDSASAFVEAVRHAARARVPSLRPQSREGGREGGVIAIGASTGGPQAVRAILAAMPIDAPPILVVQHMPAPFTRAFADQLDDACTIDVREARDGDRLRPGRALVAPGDSHMRLARKAGAYVVQIASGPLVARHRPSVDVLFDSVAREAGPAAVGVLLSGMGEDGAEGLLAMQRAGAMTVAQDRATSVVFGMAQQAIRKGAARAVLPLDAIPDAILHACA